ncbi:MAG: acyl-CoA dehydrogenase family protein [Chloroflexi bacterium]|nr:acyl-CoA dehydrogenase family protein [Chloroflexota bacterium]
MDFAFTPEQVKFRQEVQDFLKREVPRDIAWPWWFEGILGSDDMWAVARKLARKMGEKGWLSLTWPKQYGGMEKGHIELLIFTEETAYHRGPGVDIFGVKMLSPVLLAFGTEEQKKKYLPPISRGEVFWAQGFSEPNAGSDLAGLQTRAIEQDGAYIVNGQKVWSTGAHRADYIFFLARTDVQVPKHKGISFFLTEANAPGVEVRPLINMLGSHSFNEIFFTNVRVPKENLVGGKNNGWQCATALLNFERSGIGYIGACRRNLEDLVAYACNSKHLARDPRVRGKLAELAVRVDVGRRLGYRVAWMQSNGMNVDTQASMAKLFSTELMQAIDNAGMQLTGLNGSLAEGSKRVLFGGRLGESYMSNLGRTIAAGASEIQRNIIAQRGLGLPRD